MLCRNIMDQLLDQYGFSNTRTSEQTNLSSLSVGSQKINNLDPRLQYFYRRALLLEAWRFPVNYPVFTVLRDFFFVIDRLPQYVKETAQSLFSYRHLDSGACCGYFHSLIKPVTGRQHDTTGHIISNMLCNLHYTALSAVVYLQRILNKRKLFFALKLYVHDRSHNLYDFSLCHNVPAHFLFCAFAPPMTSVNS